MSNWTKKRRKWWYILLSNLHDPGWIAAQVAPSVYITHAVPNYVKSQGSLASSYNSRSVTRVNRSSSKAKFTLCLSIVTLNRRISMIDTTTNSEQLAKVFDHFPLFPGDLAQFSETICQKRLDKQNRPPRPLSNRGGPCACNTPRVIAEPGKPCFPRTLHLQFRWWRWHRHWEGGSSL